MNFSREGGLSADDIKRFFTINQMTIDLERIENVLFLNLDY